MSIKTVYFFLKRANKLAPNEITYQFILAAAHHEGDQSILMENTLNDIFKKFSVPIIANNLKELKRQHRSMIDTFIFMESYINSIIRTNTIIHEQQTPAP
ncbi:hypothetical protein VU05_02460 [Desulfobulbus sp. F1]|nr:hypothetical protein [Desulfobulbus sp. F1]